VSAQVGREGLHALGPVSEIAIATIGGVLRASLGDGPRVTPLRWLGCHGRFSSRWHPRFFCSPGIAGLLGTFSQGWVASNRPHQDYSETMDRAALAGQGAEVGVTFSATPFTDSSRAILFATISGFADRRCCGGFVHSVVAVLDSGCDRGGPIFVLGCSR